MEYIYISVLTINIMKCIFEILMGLLYFSIQIICRHVKKLPFKKMSSNNTVFAMRFLVDQLLL